MLDYVTPGVGILNQNQQTGVGFTMCVMCCVSSPGGTVHDIVSEILIY